MNHEAPHSDERLLGEAFRDTLPLAYRRALTEAAVLLEDEWFWSAASAPGEDHGLGRLRDALPPRYQLEYSPRLARQFSICLLMVAWKLAQPVFPGIACIAEQLVIRALIEQAKTLLDLDGAEQDDWPWEEFEDLVYPDADFEILFDPNRDGLDESEVGQVLGMVSFRFDDLFATQYPSTTGSLHPFLDAPARPRPEDRAATLAAMAGGEESDDHGTDDLGAAGDEVEGHLLVGRTVVAAAAPVIMDALRLHQIWFTLEWDGEDFSIFVDEDDGAALDALLGDEAPPVAE